MTDDDVKPLAAEELRKDCTHPSQRRREDGRLECAYEGGCGRRWPDDEEVIDDLRARLAELEETQRRVDKRAREMASEAHAYMMRAEKAGRERDGLRARLAFAMEMAEARRLDIEAISDRLVEVERERDEARETNRRLNRRLSERPKDGHPPPEGEAHTVKYARARVLRFSDISYMQGLALVRALDEAEARVAELEADLRRTQGLNSQAKRRADKVERELEAVRADLRDLFSCEWSVRGYPEGLSVGTMLCRLERAARDGGSDD